MAPELIKITANAIKWTTIIDSNTICSIAIDYVYHRDHESDQPLYNKGKLEEAYRPDSTATFYTNMTAQLQE